MSLSFVAIETSQTTAVHQTSLTVVKPAAAAVGDLLIACFGLSQDVPLGPPPGWLFLGQVKGTTGSNVWLGIYIRWVDGNEPAGWTWTLPAKNAGAVLAVAAYRGASRYIPQIDFFLSAGSQSGNLVTFRAATIVAIFFIDWAPVTWFGDEGQGVQFRAKICGNDNSLAIGDLTQPAAGPTGNLIVNASQTQGITAALALFAA